MTFSHQTKYCRFITFLAHTKLLKYIFDMRNTPYLFLFACWYSSWTSVFCCIVHLGTCVKSTLKICVQSQLKIVSSKIISTLNKSQFNCKFLFKSSTIYYRLYLHKITEPCVLSGFRIWPRLVVSTGTFLCEFLWWICFRNKR